MESAKQGGEKKKAPPEIPYIDFHKDGTILNTGKFSLGVSPEQLIAHSTEAIMRTRMAAALHENQKMDSKTKPTGNLEAFRTGWEKIFGKN